MAEIIYFSVIIPCEEFFFSIVLDSPTSYYYDEVLESESILFCDDADELSNDEKQKISIKLHLQFSHHPSDKLITL